MTSPLREALAALLHEYAMVEDHWAENPAAKRAQAAPAAPDEGRRETAEIQLLRQLEWSRFPAHVKLGQCPCCRARYLAGQGKHLLGCEMALVLGASSNGKTAGFDPADGGSTPPAPASHEPRPDRDDRPPAALADAAMLVRREYPHLAEKIDALIASWPAASPEPEGTRAPACANGSSCYAPDGCADPRDRCIRCKRQVLPQDFAPDEPVICLECSEAAPPSPAPEVAPCRECGPIWNGNHALGCSQDPTRATAAASPAKRCRHVVTIMRDGTERCGSCGAPSPAAPAKENE